MSKKKAAFEILFEELAKESEDPEVIGSDGIESLCSQCGISDLEDVRALVLCWKLGACTQEPLQPGCIKRSEFEASMKSMRKDSIADLAKMLPSLDTGFMEAKEFRDFYVFVHKFSREDGTQKKFLDNEFVQDLMPIVLDANRAPHLHTWLAFLATRPATEAITADQWDSFLLFNSTVSLDLKGYDEVNGAWPCLIDDYVEYVQEQNKGKGK